MAEIKTKFTSPFWRSLPFYVGFTLPLSTVVGVGLGGAFWFSTLVISFIIVPLLDVVWGMEAYQPTPGDEKQYHSAFAYKLITWLYVPVHIGLIIWGSWVFASNDLAWWQQVGLIASVGVSSGALGFTISHELSHRGEWYERWMAYAILLFVSYMHFGIEHVMGHHVHVATPLDPASSRKGESFWSFLPRTVVGSWKSAFAFETRRLRRKQPLERLLKNRLYHFIIMQVLVAAGFYLLLGPWAMVFLLINCVISDLLLEVINYVEHYGLCRKEVRPGRYEKVKPHHSWNANQKISNLFLFRLQRHSDHHAYPSRRYQLLRDYNDVPQLPFGYPTMSLLAFFPPIWRLVMDHRVDNLKQNLPSV